MIRLTLVLTLVLTATAMAKLSSDDRLTQKGLGPVRVGMTEAQVEAALGHEIKVAYFNGPECGSAKLRGKTYGQFTGPKLAVVTTAGRTYATRSGLRVGDTEADIVDQYGDKAKRSKNAYDPDGHYFKVTRGNRRIVFSTDGDAITSIAGGKIPEVDYIEGCA